MKKRTLPFCVLILLLAGCASEQAYPPHQSTALEHITPLTEAPLRKRVDSWSMFTEQASKIYGVDQKLIDAIISVESGGDPTVVSRSNAIGLMQIKASTAGREVYRYQGRHGQPTSRDLCDPAINIDIGTAYLSLLRAKSLAGIRDPETMRYALIVSYANGAGALLRTFSSDRERAITKINAMSPEAFYQHVQRNHPAAQAPRYLWKVITAYRTIS
ncbi:membrane-bound lytic murein transglycosylase E [Izhakiella capsodis]|uniref:peptidoglycan lytic exotransglycosylase n=1 Tax=Izhakiella capsodis TaxID=1367852 RepID=A0A1I4UUL4_9GAMM|nr:membrane-bound lytic murein transglycosylase EmtA [Izhakiella capsodis]SFM92588.1 membrane-bound lytic murein transglycosylase E [Izhakiella capsodis]